MRKTLKAFYYFLPVQLFLLHFRKYQLLLIFWYIVLATTAGNFAQHFGAASLFLAPEYLGKISFASMALLGGAMGVYLMSWHITTFIIHSYRMPYIGATRHAFLNYCINNSILPLVALFYISCKMASFQYFFEHFSVAQVVGLQIGFYTGMLVIIFLSFLYFFRFGKDLLKLVVAKITNPSRIREIVPYDTLDVEHDIIKADTYLDGFRVLAVSTLQRYPPRLLNTVLRRHHRNAITATLFAFLLLLLLGYFMEEPFWRLPAGSGFLILFSILLGFFGAMKYFLRSWELIGWLMLFALLSFLVKVKVFDLRSVAFGMNYHTPNKDLPEYSYKQLLNTFTPERYNTDKNNEILHLLNWKKNVTDSTGKQQPLVVITVSGGGSRSAYFTFRCLQYLDSITHGRVYDHTVLLTGASGGMIGAAYWRNVQYAYRQKRVKDPYDVSYQQNMGKDLLNAIVFSFASVDLISPYNRVKIGKYGYTKDRGYAMEQELLKNTDQLLAGTMGSYTAAETTGRMPMLVITPTIINDGRRLLIGSQPMSYLGQPEFALGDTLYRPIDAVDYSAFFANQDPYNLRLVTALRINAAFPYILPVVRMPSRPAMNLIDAGLRDNFGTELCSRFLYVFRDWMQANTSNIIYIQIRDTREYQIHPPTDENTLGKMLGEPLFAIQGRWEMFQSFNEGYLKDYAPWFIGHKLKFITLQYIPKEAENGAKLNFHVTKAEQDDLFESIYNPINKVELDSLRALLQ